MALRSRRKLQLPPTSPPAQDSRQPHDSGQKSGRGWFPLVASAASANPPRAGSSFTGGARVLREDKERIVTELAGELGAAETLIVADYRGLTNKQLESLRDVLLEHGARFRIVKNSLSKLAAERA